VQKAHELLPSLGRLFSAQVRVYQQWGNYYEVEGVNPARWVFEKYGGAVLKCAASHMIDMTLHLLGRPQHLYAHVDYISGTDFDRKATSLFEYQDGLVVSFEAATHPLKRVGYERNAWDERLQINGVNGRLDICTVKWDQPEHNAALLVHYDDRTETSTEYRFAAINPFHREMAYFCDCLERREQGRPDVIDGFNVDTIIGAMVESGRRAAVVELDWRGY
jgi:predicted dehydrogenase